jgi:hypothetical protein
MVETGRVDRPAEAASELDAAYTPVYPPQTRRAKGGAKAELARLKRDLDDPYSTPFPDGWPLSSGANYRAAFLRALKEANPDAAHSRRQLADLWAWQTAA